MQGWKRKQPERELAKVERQVAKARFRTEYTVSRVSDIECSYNFLTIYDRHFKTYFFLHETIYKVPYVHARFDLW